MQREQMNEGPNETVFLIYLYVDEMGYADGQLSVHA